LKFEIVTSRVKPGNFAVVFGISAPGNHVDVTADMDVAFVISICPQVNNPCNGFNPTPIRGADCEAMCLSGSVSV